MGAIKDQLRADLAVAMRAKDEAAKMNIRLTLGAINNEELAGETPRALSEADELAVVSAEVRKRRESAQLYAAAGRQELADKENAEAEWLSRYLPAALTTEELAAIVDDEIATAEGTSRTTLSHHIEAVKARVNGRAEGKAIAELVRAALAKR